MIEIKDFKINGSSCSHFYGSESELLKDEGFLKLKQIYEYLIDKGYCHVRIKGGDYDGSIAKFTVDSNDNDKLYRFNSYSRQQCYLVKYYWNGRLSWKGKKNNPSFIIMFDKCDVLLDYEGDEILKRFNIKEEGNKLLEQPVHDIDGKVLSKEDEVLYMNLRYGSGGKLCHGVIKDFKAHARDGYVSVIVTNKDDLSEESECRQPFNQIYKK